MLRTPLALTLSLLFAPAAIAQNADTPRAIPLYSNVEQGPAFMLECVNSTGGTLSAIQVIAETALRVDGALIERTGGIAGSFIGGVPTFTPGQQWTMMVGLRQRDVGTTSAAFGAVLRSPWHLPLADGPHTIAFRCAGAWSDTIDFVWESTTLPR